MGHSPVTLHCDNNLQVLKMSEEAAEVPVVEEAAPAEEAEAEEAAPEEAPAVEEAAPAKKAAKPKKEKKAAAAKAPKAKKEKKGCRSRCPSKILSDDRSCHWSIEGPYWILKTSHPKVCHSKLYSGC